MKETLGIIGQWLGAATIVAGIAIEWQLVFRHGETAAAWTGLIAVGALTWGLATKIRGR